jgi:hypothetical protein
MTKVSKNKTRKKKGGSGTDMKQLEKFEIKNPKFVDYSMVFGKDNALKMYNKPMITKRMSTIPRFKLYKIPLNKEKVARIECANNNDKNGHNISNIKLYNYGYIDNSDCNDHDSIHCEIQHTNNYNHLLDKSNPFSRNYENISYCLNNTLNPNAQKDRGSSPTSVADNTFVPINGGKRRKTKKSKRKGRTIKTNKRSKTKKTKRTNRKTIKKN